MGCFWTTDNNVPDEEAGSQARDAAAVQCVDRALSLRDWGIFNYDDRSSLDESGQASYVFSMYYKVQNQTEGSCNFDRLVTITFKNPSQGNCSFMVQIAPPAPLASAPDSRRLRLLTHLPPVLPGLSKSPGSELFSLRSGSGYGSSSSSNSGTSASLVPVLTAAPLGISSLLLV